MTPSHRRRDRSQQRHRRGDRPRPRRARASACVCAARRTDRIEALAARDRRHGRHLRRHRRRRRSPALADGRRRLLTCWSTTPAARSASTRSTDADPDDWRRMYDVNVLGLLRVTQALLPALRASGDGADRQRRLDRRAGRLRGRRRLHRGQARHEGGHRDAAARAGRRADPDQRDRARAWCAPTSSRWSASTATRPSADAVYAGVAEPLVAEDVADAIAWVATRPSHVNIDELVIKPRAQAAQHKVHRV